MHEPCMWEGEEEASAEWGGEGRLLGPVEMVHESPLAIGRVCISMFQQGQHSHRTGATCQDRRRGREGEGRRGDFFVSCV